MNRALKQTSNTWMVLVAIGIFSVFFSLLPPISRVFSEYRKMIITRIDQHSLNFFSYMQTAQMKIRNDMDLPNKLSTLEQYNRKLTAQIVEGEQRISLLEQACGATASARQKKESTTKSFLSKVDGRWIILSGSREGIQPGQVVLLDNMYVGSVETVLPNFSTLTTLTEVQKPLLTLHENSRELALFTLEKGKFIIRFSKRLDKININDTIISVPDGKNSLLSYPVGIVTALSTTASDSVTMVEIKVMAEPKVGLSVDVVKVGE